MKIFRRLAIAALVVCCTAFPAAGENDLLIMPAEKTDAAPHAILMDVANVDGRLIAVGERGHIIWSDDSGVTWVQADVPVSVTLTAVHFPTHKKGWAVGHDGVVLHSEDEGETWKKQLDGWKINDLMLSDLKEVIQVKSKVLEDEYAQLGEEEKADLELELEDLDFFLSDLEIAKEEGHTRPLMDVWFENDRHGFVMGAFGMILETRDGGGTWKTLLDRIRNPYGYHYYAITRSGDHLFIAGEAGILYRSGDLGQTWEKLLSPYEGSFFGIIGDPEGRFVTAFGLRGHMYYSTDRGVVWMPAQTGRKASLSGGVFLSDGSYCVAGVDGVILRSTDRGKSFSALSARFPGSVALAESDDGMLVVVGLRGVTRIDVNK